VDADPVWDDLLAARLKPTYASHDYDRLVNENFYRLPIVLRAEVADPVKLALFLTSARAFIDQTLPGYLVWEVRTHAEQPYVCIGQSPEGGIPSQLFPKRAIYYAAMPSALVISITEGALMRAIDRERARANTRPDAPEPEGARPWLGESACMQAERAALEAIFAVFAREQATLARDRSWDNLPILNEWKRRYPDADPVKAHEQLWHTTLLCPGGGAYVWNEKWRTMESTVYGHPAQPKAGPAWPKALDRLRAGNFGLTFEPNGLRARAVLEMEQRR
jgi:hypothetical protein